MYMIEKTITRSDLAQIEKYADKLFAKVGIDVEFTRHFVDRVNDERNQKQITSAELVRIFNQTYKKHGKPIAKLGPDAEAVMKDMKTDINMPFVLKLVGNKLELIAKTIMRKKDFKTSNKTFAVEQTLDILRDRTMKDGKLSFIEFNENRRDRLRAKLSGVGKDMKKTADKANKTIGNTDDKKMKKPKDSIFRSHPKYESYEIGTPEYLKHTKEVTPGESLEENPRIVSLNIQKAKDDIKTAITALTAAKGKHADQSTKMKANKAIKALQTAMREIG